MAQVEPLGYALPYEALWRGGWRQLVDAKEGVALAGDVLHEGDAQFVERDGAQVVVVVADVGQGGVGVRGCPPFSDGGHKVRRVALVVPFGVLIFGTPDDDAQVVGQGLAPVDVGRFLFVADAKEAEVFAYGLELVALGEHTLAQAFGVAGEKVDGVGVGLAHRGEVAPEAFQRAGRKRLVESRNISSDSHWKSFGVCILRPACSSMLCSIFLIMTFVRVCSFSHFLILSFPQRSSSGFCHVRFFTYLSVAIQNKRKS